MWCDLEMAMFLLELVAALCAVCVCGPCVLACARRLVLGEALVQASACGVHEARVLGCEEPACPYYKKNVRYLMVPARRRRHFNSPARPCS